MIQIVFGYFDSDMYILIFYFKQLHDKTYSHYLNLILYLWITILSYPYYQNLSLEVSLCDNSIVGGCFCLLGTLFIFYEEEGL